MFWCRIGDVKRREGAACYVLRATCYVLRVRLRVGGEIVPWVSTRRLSKCDWGSREALRN